MKRHNGCVSAPPPASYLPSWLPPSAAHQLGRCTLMPEKENAVNARVPRRLLYLKMYYPETFKKVVLTIEQNWPQNVDGKLLNAGQAYDDHSGLAAAGR
jgi:hypothetical protein